MKNRAPSTGTSSVAKDETGVYRTITRRGGARGSVGGLQLQEKNCSSFRDGEREHDIA